ncbi:LysM peptidoglycan-binding domain-containing protein [Sporosarcina newyorkensis]|uniref:LysM peptidoglycan-binding domain-containing protein n=1 Tax=Sporosarcina newyorkensis TaxID=759851 RepID=UPI003D079C5E
MEVHIVVKGDTLWKIARQYNIPFEELKRVNAHLANPDYIVPGMKIFLPMDKKKPTHKGESSKPHDKTPQKPAKPSQPEMKPPTPAPKPTPKPEKPHPPAQQVPPLPQKPQMPQTPQKPHTPPPQKPQLPQKPQTPQTPQYPQQPLEPQTPPAPQMPMMPNMPSVPMWQAVFPICGWMPIFDADCHPHMPQQPIHPPMQAPIKPLPPKAPIDCHDESPHHHKPAPMPDGWQLLESSSLHMPIKPLPTPKPPVMQPKPPVTQPKPIPPKVEQPMPMPMPMQNQPSIPPKACTPASWCPSNQDYCSPQWPIQPQWPMNTECMPSQPPMQWYPMACYPPASMMPLPYPGPYPQQMHPPFGQQNESHYPMPIQDDWYRNQ